jgi:hypothetical protein
MMEKQLIPRSKLKSEVLDLLCREPGCEGVKEVDISEVQIINEGTTSWRVTVADYGNSKRSIADHAAKRIRDILITKYDLAD